ncbi:MAG: nitroreductase, partial [Actinobacteria bacterium]|nr:nitroreductase [Actinomycetota bacterium]
MEHTAEGLVVALPYGTSPDWLKNVLAAGSAVVEADGRTHHVNDPQVVRTAEVEEHFTAKERR